jgi:hypothetical protein
VRGADSRDAIARLGHNMVFVIGGMLFVFCSHTLFPFQMDAQLADWVMFVAFTFGRFWRCSFR